MYGLCNSPNFHGHNYELDVTVEGEVDPRSGYVLDLGRLKEMVEEAVVRDLDHRNLNHDVPWLSGVIPSTENLVVKIWERLVERVSAGRLVRLVLWETPRNYAEYTGE
jgi:6-pyruvoyltetrahydropterin/6-carboxytetrahydropterin synthase